MNLTVTRNDEAGEFQATYEGKKAFIEFKLSKNRIFLVHTEVPKGLEGKGVGSALVSETLKLVEESGHVLFPLCPFVASYLRQLTTPTNPFSDSSFGGLAASIGYCRPWRPHLLDRQEAQLHPDGR